MRLCLLLSIVIGLSLGPEAVRGQGGASSISQIFSQFGSGISSALQNPGQMLASYFPQGLAGLFPFSIANLPSLPPLQMPQQVPQMMMNGMRNVTRIIRFSMSNPAASTVALLAAPLLPLMAMGGPANLAGMHHSMQMGFGGRSVPHSAIFGTRRRRRRSVEKVYRRLFDRRVRGTGN